MPVEQETFETTYGQLEEAVQLLEQGGLALNDSIALFEQGMRLAKRCRDLLDGAELKVTSLLEEYRSDGIGSPEGSDSW